MASLMSPLDAIFMAVEKPSNPMHIGGLHLFAPAEDQDAEDLVAMLSAAGQTVIAEFFSRRATRTWSSAGQWAWQPAGDIDRGYHIQQHRLPGPGGLSELTALCARLHATQLDRSRPLWQAHLITGLDDGRFALYFKLHHCLGDGQLTQRLLRATLSRDPSRRGAPIPWSIDSAALPMTSHDAAGRTSLRSEAAGLASVLSRCVGTGLRNEGGPFSFAAPRSMLNPATISADRAFAARSWPTARIAAVRSAASVTSNDVVLAMCAGALRAYLSESDALPAQPLIALVPVALRGTGAISAGGNSVGALTCSLATDRCDAADRLAVIHEWTKAGKAALSRMTPTQILAVTALGVSPLLVAPVLGRVTRPPFNVIISNVSGPRAGLYFNGARLTEVYPLSIPMDGQALNITCSTYAGHLSFGITGCAAALPGLSRFTGLLDNALRELESATGLG